MGLGLIDTGHSCVLSAMRAQYVVRLKWFLAGLPVQEGPPGDKQDPAAGGSRPRSKVKSIDLPIATNTIRQVNRDVLNDFVDYEVSALPEGCDS
jgi:hypothetical protein